MYYHTTLQQTSSSTCQESVITRTPSFTCVYYLRFLQTDCITLTKKGKTTELTDTQYIVSNRSQSTSKTAAYIRIVCAGMRELADSAILIKYLYTQG
jgi:hypothetical protein